MATKSRPSPVVADLINAIVANDGPGVASLARRLGRRALGQCIDADHTAVALACERGAVAALEALLSNGAPPDSPAAEGFAPRFTVLECCARHGKSACLRPLLRYGAPVSPEAVFFAACGDHLDALDALLEHAPGPMQSPSLGDPVRAAAGSPSPAALTTLLARGYPVDTPGPNGEHPLHYAAATGQAHGVALLLAHGADPDVQDVTHQQTPLMLACARGHARCVTTLLGAGCRHDIAGERGETALMHAARHGRSDVVRLLLEAGAETRHRRTDNRTARELAVAGGHRHVLEILDAHGRAAHLTPPTGRTGARASAQEPAL